MVSKRRDARPTAEEAARRLLVLRYVVGYAYMTPPRDNLQALMDKWSKDERLAFVGKAEAIRDEIWGTVRELGLWPELAPTELELAGKTAVTMSLREQINATWRIEALQVLAWALRLVPELPSYDTQANADLVGMLAGKDPAEFIKSARLRPKAQIDKARDIAELWHWRSRTRQLIEQGSVLHPSEQMKAAGIRSYDDIVRSAASKALEAGDISSCIDGDFPAKGKAYRDLTAEEYADVTSITSERHFAFNWLCGFAPDNQWDETPTDT